MKLLIISTFFLVLVVCTNLAAQVNESIDTLPSKHRIIDSTDTIPSKPKVKTLDEVVVTGAGSFEASDKSKGAALTPMDAVTVAGNGGDIANAMRFLPGAQQVGEREGLFVRGGSGEEAKQFVDGALLKNPNYTPIPGYPQYARLNPFLFKGILFSSGAYSALYGQAMSSALILESADLPSESALSFSLFPMQVSAGFQQLAPGKKSGYGVNARYSNHFFYNQLIGVRPDFFHAPEYVSVDANYRVKTRNDGMLKFYTNYGYDHTGVSYVDPDNKGSFLNYEGEGKNLYANLSLKQPLGKKWKLDGALAYNRNIIQGQQENNLYETNSHFAQARVVATRRLAGRQAIRFGAEQFYTRDIYGITDTLHILQDQLSAAFAESDIYLADGLAAKVGMRAEYSSLLKTSSIAPRISLAYRFEDGGQVNMAYGKFYQKPELIHLYQNSRLDFGVADHYILNYQKKSDSRLLRLEGFYKKYKDLVTTTPTIVNGGKGYAKGVELFFRDKKTFKNYDYWITYTYLDTRRKYLDYPGMLAPEYSTPHTASIAVKRFFEKLNFNVNMSYMFATGRPYYNIQQDEQEKTFVFDKGTTKNYNSLNLSFAYLFSLFKKDFTGVGFGINNVFGRDHVFGYNYSADGTEKVAVMQPSTRNYYFGIFMSFGTDRRQDFIDENF